MACPSTAVPDNYIPNNPRPFIHKMSLTGV